MGVTIGGRDSAHSLPRTLNSLLRFFLDLLSGTPFAQFPLPRNTVCVCWGERSVLSLHSFTLYISHLSHLTSPLSPPQLQVLTTLCPEAAVIPEPRLPHLCPSDDHSCIEWPSILWPQNTFTQEPTRAAVFCHMKIQLLDPALTIQPLPAWPTSFIC